MVGHNKMAFSTKDRDNDQADWGNCATSFKGAWWYYKCHFSNLNGLYHHGQHSSFADGVNWITWKGYRYSVKRAEMKIRPVDFHKDAGSGAWAVPVPMLERRSLGRWGQRRLCLFWYVTVCSVSQPTHHSVGSTETNAQGAFSEVG